MLYTNLSKGDIVTEINGMEIRGIDDFYEVMRSVSLGNAVFLKLLRNGVPMEIEYFILIV